MKTISEVALELISKGISFNCHSNATKISIPKNYLQLDKWELCFYVDGILKFYNTLAEEIDDCNKY